MFELSQNCHVSVAHRYWTPALSAAENRALYGDLVSSEGVGSNLELRLGVRQAPEARDLDLSQYLGRLKSLCDHRCLFAEEDEFRERASTLERLTQFLAARVFPEPLPHAAWSFLEVTERAGLSCRATAEREDVTLIERAFNLTGYLRGAVDPVHGLVCPRGTFSRAVRTLAPRLAEATTLTPDAWANGLFESLRVQVKELQALEIDLGSQQRLRVARA